MKDLTELLARCSQELAIRRVIALRVATKSACGFPRCELLSHITSLPAAILASRGTSFVWHAAERYLTDTNSEHAEALAVCCFDAYYSSLPIGVTLQIRKPTLLPALGMVAHSAVERCSDEAAGRLVNTQPMARLAGPQAHEHVFRAVPSNVTIISLPTPDLFDAESNRYVSANGAEDFAALVEDGFAMIRSVSSSLYREILCDVKWAVKVISPSPDVHRSYTTASLDGVLFLSHVPATITNRTQIIAEAIVHERSHLHVHRIMNVFPLHMLSERERFYSPWRNDPRSLSGLVHGLYVLARLSEFYKTALQGSGSRHNAKLRGFLRQRLSWCQVSAAVGLLQVPTAALTAEGLIVVEDIREATRMDGSDPDVAAFETANAHVNLWRKQNSALSSCVKVPQWL